jgi:PAS domain S-box-containing protein
LALILREKGYGVEIATTERVAQGKALAHLRQRIAELEAADADRERAQDELSVAYDALNSSVSGVIIADLEGRVRYANPAFVRMFEYREAAQVLGRRAAELFPSQRVQKLSDVTAIIDRARGETEGFLARRQDGTVFPVEVSSSVVTDKEGNDVGRIASFADITQRKQMEAELTERAAQLEAANQELADFAYIVSHDLKAPLRAISQLATWLSADYADALDESGREMLQLIAGRAKRMQGLIDGILRYSRIGRVRESETLVDLYAVVQETIDMLFPPQSIQITVEGGWPCVVGEKTRLGQVFENLLDNAIKFMDKPEGQISIGCMDEGTHWLFHVTDNGPGIEEEHYPKLFQLFQTLAPRDQFESTGVGLAVVKKTVELWGGSIWVESTVGQGSTFYFTLPKGVPGDEKH